MAPSAASPEAYAAVTSLPQSANLRRHLVIGPMAASEPAPVLVLVLVGDDCEVLVIQPTETPQPSPTRSGPSGQLAVPSACGELTSERSTYCRMPS